MELKRRIFVRTVALLAGLVLVTALIYISFVMKQNRRILDEYTHKQIVFVSYQAESLVLWDDRVALRRLLIDLVRQSRYISYAFVEINGSPYVDTFKSGTPSGLLGRNVTAGDISCVEFKDEKGNVYYDHTYKDPTTGAVLHIGLSKQKMDAMTSGLVRIIALYSGLLMLICLAPGWLVSSAITKEVTGMNAELNRMNRELETRVEERTSELVKANESLTREMEERTKLEKQRDEFLSMCRHDMRSPLSVIRGYSELLREDVGEKLGQEAAGMVDSVIRNSENLSKMIDDFSELSRLEAGKPVLGSERVNLVELAAEVYISFKMEADTKGVGLGNDVPQELPILDSDTYYIRRALANLVSNAIKYTPSGGTIVMGGGVSGDGGQEGSVFLSVSDTGPGIPDDERARIFEKYFRARSSKGIHGYGLGLPIVKAIMDACKGRVELETEPGKGSTFRLVFPLSG